MPLFARRERVMLAAVLALVAAVGAPVGTGPLGAQSSGAVQDTTRPQLPVPPLVDSASLFPQSLATDTALAPKGPTDPAELEAWLDGYMASIMAEDHVAGATVLFVRDGQIFLSKGYGFADVDARTPVDPAVTLFRIGSVSKLFVWTSVMQLVERGMLELDVDVNTYLEDIEIPATYERPVTLEDILTHSAGFEDHVIGLFAESEDGLRPLGQILAEQLPDRVRPPGEASSYSNHATGLAMYIVETVSGTPWEQYIQENILDPLRMEHFSFSQPLPPSLADDMSHGYSWAGGNYVEEDFEFVPLAPVGAASASAEDMAKFMIAHLQLGEFEGRRILEESTALEMQSVLFRHAPEVNAMLHGFADMSSNGEWVVGHGGDTFFFHTQFAFMPDRDLGVFISTNSANGNPSAVLDAFADRYFSVEEPAATTPADSAGGRDAFVGLYRANRLSHTDPAKLAALAGGLRVTANDDGTLRLSNTGDARWIETAPLAFRQEHESDLIAFRQGDDGVMSHLFIGSLPYFAFERVPFLENPALHGWLAGFAVLLFLLTVIVWPLSGFFRIRFGAELREPRLSGLARFLLWGAALFFLATLCGLGLVVSDPNGLALGNTGMLSVVGWLSVIGAAFTVGSTLYTLYVWYDSAGSRPGRIAYTLVTLALITFLWQLNTFNLVGWRF